MTRLRIPIASDPVSAVHGWGSELRKHNFVVRGEEPQTALEVGPFILPVGAIVPFIGSVAPDNWSILGVTLYVAEYPELAKVMSAIPPQTTFAIPTAAALGLPVLIGATYCIKAR